MSAHVAAPGTTAGATRDRHGERWGIVGGGILGLTLAHRLSQQGASVTVWEAAPQLGGLTSPWQVGDVVWDRFYHVTLLSDTALRALLAEAGVEDRLEWVVTRTGAYAGGRLWPLSGPADYLRFPLLRYPDKFRLGVTIVVGTMRRDWRRLERIPVQRWLTRWSGSRTFDAFWLPLLRAKLGDGYRQSSAAFIWATIQRLSAARRAGLHEERFGYVAGGYATTIAAIADMLVKEGVELRCASPVARVGGSGPTLVVEGRDGTSVPYDGVVITSAPPIAAALCPDIDPSARASLAAMPYQGVICTSVVLTRPLAGYYLTYLMDDAPFTTIIEMTSLVDPSQLGGRHLVYLPQYLASDDPMFDQSDAEIEARVLAGLRAIHPEVTDDDIVAVRTARARVVFPLPTLGYSTRVHDIQTSVPGVHLVSSAQIVNGTLNANEGVLLADRVADRLEVAQR